FSLRLRKQTKDVIDKKVREAASILNLTRFLDRSPRQLSGGQRQRVAMGRALVRDAQVFLFDEPLSNLDAKLRVVMRTEIKALHQRLRTTSVYVTHDQIEAMTMADRIVVMNAGRIEQIGSPLDLYDTPANLFVADFIGSPSMNFVRGTLRAGDGRAWLEVAGGPSLPVPASRAALAGRQVVLGIRPEHAQLAATDPGVALTVVVVEPTGANIQVFADLGGAHFCAIFTERHVFRPGDTVRLTFPEDKIHLFDAESGVRL
ncbi:MAG: TOBE domain-containing protein, partial [Candidatus Saccharibacteria bacterium]|nr:TOBE domain-containing protein [Pseudorhodobacter sp.]